MSAKQQILVIEDHKAIRIVLGNFLAKHFIPTVVADGFEGLAWLKSGNIPSAIILDLNTPKMSGLDFLNNLRCSGFFKDVPVIILSGTEDSATIEKCLELGISGFFKKPFNPAELNDKLLAIFDENKNTAEILKS